MDTWHLAVANLTSPPVLAFLLGLLATYPAVIAQLRTGSLVERPATLCMVGLLMVVVLSHLQFGSLYGARTSGSEFGKLVVFKSVRDIGWLDNDPGFFPDATDNPAHPVSVGSAGMHPSSKTWLQ